MTTQPSSPFDISPMWKMYMEPIELWKKNYENFLKSTPFRADGHGREEGRGIFYMDEDISSISWIGR